MEVICQLYDPVALPQGKESPITIVYEVRWVLEPVWTL